MLQLPRRRPPTVLVCVSQRGREGRSRPSAKVIKPQRAPAKEEASTRPREATEEARALERARARARTSTAKDPGAEEKARERFQRLMTKVGPTSAREALIGIGQWALSGHLQSRPSQDGLLQQPLGRHRWRQPRPFG